MQAYTYIHTYIHTDGVIDPKEFAEHLGRVAAIPDIDACIHACMHTYIHTDDIHTCIDTHIHAYIDTYIHTYRWGD